VKEALPDQVTLVPDSPDAITSNAGWDTIKNEEFLKRVVSDFKALGIRTSIFIDADLIKIEKAVKTNTDRVELYTESYAQYFQINKAKAIKPYIEAAILANELGLGINAGHDLNLENLKYFNCNVPNLLEVSIGHALICDALYFGLENVIQMYLKQLIPS
jgi:pyridoxine 5-phosphate synthase